MYFCSYAHPSVPFSGSQTQDRAFLGSGPEGDNDLCIHTWGIFFFSICTSQLELWEARIGPWEALMRLWQAKGKMGPQEAHLGPCEPELAMDRSDKAL